MKADDKKEGFNKQCMAFTLYADTWTMLASLPLKKIKHSF